MQGRFIIKHSNNSINNFTKFLKSQRLYLENDYKFGSITCQNLLTD